MKYFDGNEEALGTKAEINMSPLIDMTFLLLIFFMVTAVFVQESGVKVDKPRAATAESLAQENLLITLAKDGSVHYGGREVSPSQLPSIVKSVQGGKLPVVIVADDDVSTGTLVRIIDLCRLGGAVEVNIAANKVKP